MAIIKLSELAKGSTAVIKKIESSSNGNSNPIAKKLSDIGFVSGRKIEIQGETWSGLRVKIENDSTLAMRKTTANMILVQPLEKDVFKSITQAHRKSLWAKFLNFLFEL